MNYIDGKYKIAYQWLIKHGEIKEEKYQDKIFISYKNFNNNDIRGSVWIADNTEQIKKEAIIKLYEIEQERLDNFFEMIK